MAIKDVEQFLLNCKAQGRVLCDGRLPSIYIIPSAYRVVSPRSFNPTVVSIGPLLRQNENLKEYEVQKTTYLHHLLNRSSSVPEETLKECVGKVMGKIQDIKAWYPESQIYNDDELAQMMVIDACYILFFVHLLSEHDGPFLVNRLVVSNIIFDLLRIENQIPFFVLEDIFQSTIQKFKQTTSLIIHMRILFKWTNIFKDDMFSRAVTLDPTQYHILSLLHNFLRPTQTIGTGSTITPKKHSAVELQRAGVNFTPIQDLNCSLSMKVESLLRFSWFPWYWRRPTLRMPIFSIHEGSEWILKNLIIYENGSSATNFVTTYMWAMSMLIDSPEDIAVLVKSGVLTTTSTDQEALDMIHNICKEVYFNDFGYHKEWEELDRYYNSYWPNALAGLKRTYFSSPWKMIALFAGILLFLLTVVQTIFTIQAANLKVEIKN